MKKIFTLGIISLLLISCDELDELLEESDDRRVVYTVKLKDVAMNFDKSTMISYVVENGNTEFDDHASFNLRWSKLGGVFSKGDRVSLGINTTLNRGTITLIITCKDCKNEDLINGEMKKIIDLSKIKVGDLSMNLE